MRTDQAPRIRATRLFLLAATLVLLGACSGVPNLDAGMAGCSNARGIGPTADPGGGPQGGDEMAVMPDLHGRTPAEAAAAAAAAGHTAVFNVDGECWCAPPPGGTITMSWWGQHGALWLWVDGLETGHQPGDAPFMGWGC
jgi:hypothetical protein